MCGFNRILANRALPPKMRRSSLRIHKLWSSLNKRPPSESKLQLRIPRLNGNVLPKTEPVILQNRVSRRHFPSAGLPNGGHSRTNRNGEDTQFLHFIFIASKCTLHSSAATRRPKMALLLANGRKTTRRQDFGSSQNNSY